MSLVSKTTLDPTDFYRMVIKHWDFFFYCNTKLLLNNVFGGFICHTMKANRDRCLFWTLRKKGSQTGTEQKKMWVMITDFSFLAELSVLEAQECPEKQQRCAMSKLNIKLTEVAKYSRLSFINTTRLFSCDRQLTPPKRSSPANHLSWLNRESSWMAVSV